VAAGLALHGYTLERMAGGCFGSLMMAASCNGGQVRTWESVGQMGRGFPAPAPSRSLGAMTRETRRVWGRPGHRLPGTWWPVTLSHPGHLVTGCRVTRSPGAGDPVSWCHTHTPGHRGSCGRCGRDPGHADPDRFRTRRPQSPGPGPGPGGRGGLAWWPRCPGCCPMRRPGFLGAGGKIFPAKNIYMASTDFFEKFRP